MIRPGLPRKVSGISWMNCCLSKCKYDAKDEFRGFFFTLNTQYSPSILTLTLTLTPHTHTPLTPHNKSGTLQSISVLPVSLSNSLHFEKCLQPKNPVLAEKGEGCGAFSIICLLESISSALF